MKFVFKPFEKSYIRRNGKILTGGIIQILALGVQDPSKGGESEIAGVAMFSPKLAKYGSSRFYTTADMVKKVVRVINKKKRKTVRIIPFDEFQSVHVWTCIVMKGGWLKTIGAFGEDFKILCDSTALNESLQMAERGEKPRILDNSTFVQVSGCKVGQRVINIEYGKYGDEKHAVFTRKGKPIKHRASKPLSYKKWESLHSLS